MFLRPSCMRFYLRGAGTLLLCTIALPKRVMARHIVSAEIYTAYREARYRRAGMLLRLDKTEKVWVRDCLVGCLVFDACC